MDKTSYIRNDVFFGGGLTAKKNKMGVKNVTCPISPTLVSLGRRNSVTLPKIEGEIGQIH